MEMQQFDAEDEGSFVGDKSNKCEFCPFVLIVFISIAVVLDIVAVIHCATVPSNICNALIALGATLSCVSLACGVIIYFKTCHSTKLSNTFQSSSEDIYDEPWNIREEAEDYGIMNPGMQSSLPRYTAEVGIHKSRNQRHSKHPIKLSELQTLEYKSTGNGELFNYFTDRPELEQHQVENRNEMEYLPVSFKVRGERRSHERKERSPMSSLEATEHRYRNNDKIDCRELDKNESWSRRGRCRSRYIQERGAEPNVYQSKSTRLTKHQPRSKSETRDYKSGRNMAIRQNSSNCNKTESPVAKGTEIAEYKNMKMKRRPQLLSSKSDSNIYLSGRRGKHSENENEEAVYNQNTTTYRQQISQSNRETWKYPSNRNESIDPRKYACSPTSKTHKIYPAAHRQHNVPLPLSSEREGMQHASEYGRITNSLANSQSTGKYTFRNSNGGQAVQPEDGNRINSAFETEVTAFSSRSRKAMHFQSPNNAGTRMLLPKFPGMDGRYSDRSCTPNSDRSYTPTVPFSPGRIQTTELRESMKYPSIGINPSAKYSSESSEGPNNFSEQATVKSPLQTTAGQERNLWLSSSQTRQNSSNGRKTNQQYAQATNEYREAVNELLMENQRRMQQCFREYELRRNEMAINSIGSSTECMPYP